MAAEREDSHVMYGRPALGLIQISPSCFLYQITFKIDVNRSVKGIDGNMQMRTAQMCSFVFFLFCFFPTGLFLR